MSQPITWPWEITGSLLTPRDDLGDESKKNDFRIQVTVTLPDTTPPTPNPSSWLTEPYETGETSIRMVATTASDPSGVQYYFVETSGNPGGQDSGWQDSRVYVDTGLSSNTQYTYRVITRDKSSNRNVGNLSDSISATTDDTTPPTPNPSSWSMVPYATGETSIRMVATSASDPNGVQYYFDETSGNPGGLDSGWRDSRVYVDTGLSSNTQYTYSVTTRDKSSNRNVGNPSDSISATTFDETPPTPNPSSWLSEPKAAGTTSIWMVATSASDPSGVEYYFDETSGNPGGLDSGWQDESSYLDTGLSPYTSYTYQVITRDKSPNENPGSYSLPIAATTAAGFPLSTLDGSNGFRLDGIDLWDYSGYSVSSAGDVNGDGFDDLIIGLFGDGPDGKKLGG